MLASPLPLSSGDGIFISPDTSSNISSGWRPPSVLPLSVLSSFTGTWYGAGASILVSTGSVESSGRGAEHLIRSAFFIQPWKKIVCSVTYYDIQSVRELSAYRGIRMVAVEADVLGGVWPLFSFPEKQLPHSFVRSTEEVLEGPGPFGLNSHIRRGHCWHGRTRRASIT